MLDADIDLKEHIDRYCGSEPREAFVDDATGIWVARFDDVPEKGLHSFLTTGLSKTRLRQEKSGTMLRHELLICVAYDYRKLPWHELALSVARECLGSRKALALGQVLGPRGPLIPEEPSLKLLTALLCAGPAFFPDSFGYIEGAESKLIVVELVPISTAEANEIARTGWEPFFDRVDSGSVNILDLRRTGNE